MTAREVAECQRLHRLWACAKATRKQILRCMELALKSLRQR